MPSSATITSTDFTTFAARTRIRSSPMNNNFGVFRGHFLPVDPNTSSAAATKTYDIGSDDYRWRNSFASPVLPVDSTSGSMSITSAHHVVLISASGGTATASLPAISSVPLGKQFVVKKTDATVSPVIIDGSGSETIDGETTQIIDVQYEALTVISNGSSWSII